MATRSNHNETDRAHWIRLEFFGGMRCIRDNTDISVTLCDCPRNLTTGAILKLDVDIAMSRKECRQRRREQFRYCHSVREQAHVTPQALGVVTQFTAHLLQLPRDDPRMMDECRSYRREPNAAPLPHQQGSAECLLHGTDPLAR
jgi:hypothetical protein